MKKKNKVTSVIKSKFFKKILISLICFTVFFESIYSNNHSDLIIFSVLLIYIFCIKFLKISSKVTFGVCMLLLVEMFIFYISTGTSIATERFAEWLVLFMGIGIFQQWKE